MMMPGSAIGDLPRTAIGRFDLLKRAKQRKARSYSTLEYHKNEAGTILRNYPKTPSRYALKKNTRRARIYHAAVEAQVEKAAGNE